MIANTYRLFLYAQHYPLFFTCINSLSTSYFTVEKTVTQKDVITLQGEPIN